jgi:hypothetical protein
MSQFKTTLMTIKLKQSLRWVFLILGSLAFGSLLICTYLFIKGIQLKSLRLQNPIQSPLRIEQKETFLNAPRSPRIVLTAQIASEPIPVKK